MVINWPKLKERAHSPVEYYYDANGNLTKDLNKGISNIAYNSLNLSMTLAIANSFGSATNRYVYAADRRKLKAVQQWNGGSKQTDYCGNMIYENGILKRIFTGGGYIEGGAYYFYVKDHEGNNRVVANAGGTAVQSTHYYPFGMSFAEGNATSNQPCRYSGKELDTERGLNWYDYGARFYDPAIARWTSVDPLTEKYYLASPYIYCRNNPVNAFDPDGKDWVYRIIDKNVEVYYDRDVKSQADVANKYGKDAGVTHMPDGSTLTAYDKDGNITSKYTFTNDAKENKYGTVVNTDGDKLDNTQIKYGSNYTIFGTSDNSCNAETLHKNYMKTSYTGPNNPLDYNGKETYQYMPKNISEYPAMVHDMMYDKKGDRGISGALFNTKSSDADKMLYILETAIVASPNVSVVERARALAMALTFKPIFELKGALKALGF